MPTVNVFKAFLAQRLAEGGSETIFYIDRITTATGETISSSDFAEFSRGIITINPDGDGESSYPEFCSFTAVDSSALSLTGGVRGLSAKGNSVVTANKRFHPVGTPVVISLGVHNIEDIKAYVDAQVAAVTIGSSNVVLGTAGETLVAGNLVFLKTDGKWWKVDADTVTSLENVQLGIAQGAGAADGAITGGVMTRGLDTHQTGLVAGTTYYASNTAGAIGTAVGTNTRAVGVARSSTSIYFDPVTVSPLSIQNGTYVYAADAVGTDSYAIAPTPAIGSYVAGQRFYFKAGTANTGPATLAVSGLAAKDIKKNATEALITGDILANQICIVIYDGTNFQLISKTPTLMPTVQVFTSNGTWTKPAGLKYVEVELVGGGGGGGGNTIVNRASAGGGGGGYSWKLIATADLGATEAVTVGASGSGGSQTGGTGVTGGTSSFGAHLQATGGEGGTQQGEGGEGGIGSGGTLNFQGDGGAAGGYADVAGIAAGKGGGSRFGGGSKAPPASTSINGRPYGGGGSGAQSGGGDTAGGAGYAGLVVVKEFY